MTLVTFEDIAEMAGVEADTARKWEQRHNDFPERVPTTDRQARFDRDDVLAWLAKTDREATT